jgi:hypothetical protein
MNQVVEPILWMLGNAFLSKISFDGGNKFLGWLCLVASASSMSKVLLFIF